VVVLDYGKVVEYDAPYALLVKKIGDKLPTNKKGVFYSMVEETG